MGQIIVCLGADQFNAEWMLEGLQRRLIHCTIEWMDFALNEGWKEQMMDWIFGEHVPMGYCQIIWRLAKCRYGQQLINSWLKDNEVKFLVFVVDKDNLLFSFW